MKKILLLTGLLITGLIIVAYFYFRHVVSDFNVKELQTSKENKPIYLKNLKRGLNYSRLTISSSGGRRTSIEKDYIYTWDETLFYRVSNDTLFVLCKNKAETPIKFNPNVKVIQKEYSNPEYYELQKNFRKMGLEKFPQ
jgi:hypothetical protein